MCSTSSGQAASLLSLLEVCLEVAIGRLDLACRAFDLAFLFQAPIAENLPPEFVDLAFRLLDPAGHLILVHTSSTHPALTLDIAAAP